MPIRVKPVHDLGLCVLTLESIQGIADLVSRSFPISTYSAHDNIWEIYDEPKDSFLLTISQRETLDSFVVNASTMADDRSELKMVFDDKQAKVTCTAHPEKQSWFEHFMIDLKKHILPPTFAQLMAYGYRKSESYLPPPFLIRPFLVAARALVEVPAPYCRIVIHKKTPSPYVENIKAGLLTNLIWAVMGAIGLLIIQWIGNLLFR